MTPTYFAVREEIAQFTGVLPPLDVADTPKAAYGKLRLHESAGLFDALSVMGKTVSSPAPLSMEELGQDFGYLLYSTVIKGSLEPRELIFPKLHDRAHVFLDGKLSGIRDRLGRTCEIQVGSTPDEPHRLDILVENLGRINYGNNMFDQKGILGGIRLGNTFHFGWEMTSLPMDDLSALTFGQETAFDGRPRFYRGTLHIDGAPADTFLAPRGFHKGFVTVNGFNLGRYWNDKGPQKTLFLPAPLLRTGENEIVIFETDGVDAPEIEFLPDPILG
jgi:beta-galactosidase